MSKRTVQRSSKTYAKINCQNPYASHYFRQLKQTIFSNGKSLVVSKGLNHHEIMRKQRYRHIRFIRSMQFCDSCLKHEK